MSRYLVAALSLAALIAGGSTAARTARAADVPGDPPSKAVQIYAAELSSSVGIALVHDRLDQAAHYVCRAFDSREPERQMRYRRCVTEALERAVQEVHDARLSAYHRGRTGTMRTDAVVAGFPGPAR